MERVLTGLIVALIVAIFSATGEAQTSPNSVAVPKIERIDVPAEVQIGQDFTVTVKAVDETGVDGVEVAFTGKSQTLKAQGAREAVVTLKLKAEKLGDHALEATAINKNKARSRAATVIVMVKASTEGPDLLPRIPSTLLAPPQAPVQQPQAFRPDFLGAVRAHSKPVELRFPSYFEAFDLRSQHGGHLL